MNIRVYCPQGEHLTPPLPLPLTPGPCPRCGARLTPAATDITTHELHSCRFCGHDELYVQKDFPHWLGVTILLVGVAASFVAYGYYIIWLTWAILIGTAFADGILYWIVGDVVVCYRCLSQHRGFAKNPAHRPWDLTVGEKYRQERLRRARYRDDPPKHRIDVHTPKLN